MVVLCPDKHWERQKGQVLLIVVLVMIVALTVGLSLISRSVTNLRTSTEEAESQKALAAAEAGVEQALKLGTAPAGDRNLGSNNTTYSTKVTAISGASFFLNGGNAVPKDDGADVWLSNYSTDESIIFTPPLSTTLTIYWGDTGNTCDATAPALEIAVITGPKTTPSLQRYAYDACPRVGQNNFTPALSTGGVQVDIAGKNYTFKWKTPPITITNGLITRIIPIYHDGKIAVKSTAILPQQGNLIESTGTSGETKRRVNVFQGHPKIPTELFPYSIFSPQ